jgi:acyl carrier protein
VGNRLLEIINVILNKKGKNINELVANYSLRKDLGMDSLDLAELTVRIEDEFDVDIFEDGVIDTISEVMNKVNRGKE